MLAFNDFVKATLWEVSRPMIPILLPSALPDIKVSLENGRLNPAKAMGPIKFLLVIFPFIFILIKCPLSNFMSFDGIKN